MENQEKIDNGINFQREREELKKMMALSWMVKAMLPLTKRCQLNVESVMICPVPLRDKPHHS